MLKAERDAGGREPSRARLRSPAGATRRAGIRVSPLSLSLSLSRRSSAAVSPSHALLVSSIKRRHEAERLVHHRACPRPEPYSAREACERERRPVEARWRSGV